MLILTRRCGETIQIGTGVKVTIMSVKGNQVRVGIQAPEGVTILRSEILERLEPRAVAAPRKAHKA